MRRLTAVIVAVLLSLSGMAWVILVRQADAMAMAPMASGDAGMPLMAGSSSSSILAAMLHPYPGMQGIGAAWFLATWVIMMIAMMFPSVAPMVVGFAAITRRRHSGPALYAYLAAFTAGYLITWALIGVGALGLNVLVSALLARATTPSIAQAAAGLVLIAAGSYQFTGWKRTCLTHCRSALSFFLHKWRHGMWGALRMGSDHGGYCVGCCWGLMAVLFTVGLMNLAWMALLSIVIGIEKLNPRGLLAARLVGASLVLAGGLLTAAPLIS
jgi:predicted metal-binding membrane protein